MHGDPAAHIFLAIMLSILVLDFLMQRIKQPPVVAYLLVGILLGPSVLNMIRDPSHLSRLGDIGVIMLLFFVGMEASPHRLLSNWLIAIVGTLLQVVVSVFAVCVLGWLFSWSLPKIILVGFILGLSSTSVVLKLLQDWGELETRVGQAVLSILLVQDLLLIPMMIILGFLGGQRPSWHTMGLQLIGGLFTLLLGAWVTIKKRIRLPFLKQLTRDQEGRVFVSLLMCFGLAMITGLFQLSTALGAFLAGMIVAAAEETHWVHDTLRPLKTIFIALFFVSIGMQVNLQFMSHYWFQITTLVIAAFVVNTAINALILKTLGESSEVSVYAGSLLSQIGEFAFVITALGFNLKFISYDSYQLMVTTIALSLLFSPLWIMWIKSMTRAETGLLSRVFRVIKVE